MSVAKASGGVLSSECDGGRKGRVSSDADADRRIIIGSNESSVMSASSVESIYFLDVPLN